MLCVCKVCGASFKQKKEENTCNEYCEKIKIKKIINKPTLKDLNRHLSGVGGIRNRWKARTTKTPFQKKKKKNKGQQQGVLKHGPHPKILKPEEMLTQSQKWKNIHHKEYAAALEKLAKQKTIIIPSQPKVVSFYDSKEWHNLRRRVLKFYGHKCMCCGVTKTIMHVDHIKARSKYPELELDFNNMQVLCWSCNKAKSNFNEIDFRPKDKVELLLEGVPI